MGGSIGLLVWMAMVRCFFFPRKCDRIIIFRFVYGETGRFFLGGVTIQFENLKSEFFLQEYAPTGIESQVRF